MIGYDYMHSGIDSNGLEYICFMIEPERLDGYGLRNARAVNIIIDNLRQRTTVYTFNWVHGTPHDFVKVKTLTDEIITDSEVPALMKRLGIKIEGSENDGC